MHWLRQEPGNHACQKNRHALGVWGDGGSVAVLKFDRGLVCPVRNAGHIVTHLWLFLRCSRWLLWLAWLGYSIEFVIHRDQHMGTFNELSRTTEFWMFGLPLAAVTVGLFELMARDWAGIKREPPDKIGFDRGLEQSARGTAERRLDDAA
jgi:hypothetical protein